MLSRSIYDSNLSLISIKNYSQTIMHHHHKPQTYILVIPMVQMFWEDSEQGDSCSSRRNWHDFLNNNGHRYYYLLSSNSSKHLMHRDKMWMVVLSFWPQHINLYNKEAINYVKLPHLLSFLISFAQTDPSPPWSHPNSSSAKPRVVFLFNPVYRTYFLGKNSHLLTLFL